MNKQLSLAFLLIFAHAVHAASTATQVVQQANICHACLSNSCTDNCDYNRQVAVRAMQGNKTLIEKYAHEINVLTQAFVNLQKDEAFNKELETAEPSVYWMSDNRKKDFENFKARWQAAQNRAEKDACLQDIARCSYIRRVQHEKTYYPVTGVECTATIDSQNSTQWSVRHLYASGFRAAKNYPICDDLQTMLHDSVFRDYFVNGLHYLDGLAK